MTINTKAEEFKHTFQQQVAKWKDEEFRRQTHHTLLSILRGLVRNIRHGEVGHRGEEWFAGQVLLVYAVLFGRYPVIETLMKVVGCVSSLFGLYSIFRGIFDLGPLLSPFITPAEHSVVRKEGVYSLVRHPIYGGLSLFVSGLSLFQTNLSKLFLSFTLIMLLVCILSLSLLHFVLIVIDEDLFVCVEMFRIAKQIKKRDC